MGERKTGSFWVSAALLILITGAGICGTVRSGSAWEETEQLYRAREQEVVRETRCFLNENGYQNSGIALTRVVDEGDRIYTMTIHHGRIDSMTQEERRMLASELERRGGAEELGSLRYEFLIQ